MAESCIIKNGQAFLSPLDFQKLSALKLRQYCEGLMYIPGFLEFRLHNSFFDDMQEFKVFLSYLLLQFDKIIDNKIALVATDCTFLKLKILWRYESISISFA